jgi:hypothetical protein
MSPDSGRGDLAGAFKSRIVAVGPELGYMFATRAGEAYVNLRGYIECWADNRVQGRALYLTISLPLGPAPKK